MMKLLYIHHSGFAIDCGQLTVLIDFYKDDGSGFKIEQYSNKSLYILSSHHHGDHFSRDIIKSTIDKTNVKYILSDDILLKQKTDRMYFLKKGETFNDGQLKVRAFGSTDVGISFCIELEGKKIFHAGDLNNWHWNEEVSPSEAKTYENNFLKEVGEIASYMPEMDLVMFPVDPRLGKDYTLGPQQFLSKIKTKVFVPMHFWGDFNKANAFSTDDKEIRFVKWSKSGDFIEF